MIGGEKDIKSLLSSFIVENNLQDQYYLEILKNKADELFSQKINNDIKLISLKKGHLTIKSESSAWKEELKLRRQDLIKKFNDQLQKEIIKSIEVK